MHKKLINVYNNSSWLHWVQLSASIAHEIRNPLAAITQANELMQANDPRQELLQNMITNKPHGLIKLLAIH